MTTYILTAPNGKEVEIDSPNPPTQELANQVFAAAGINSPTSIDQVAGAVSSFTHGGSLGLADKVGGAINALGAAPVDALLTDKPFMQAVKDRYNEVATNSKSARENFARNNPLIALGLEIAGNVTGAAPKAIYSALAGKGLKGAKLLVGTAGIEGGIQRAADSERLSDVPENAAMGGLSAAVTAWGIDKVLRGLKNADFLLKPEQTKYLRAGETLKKSVGEEKLQQALKDANRFKQDIVEVGGPEINFAAKTVREQTPEANYIFQNRLNRINEKNPDYGQYIANLSLGTTGRRENVDSIIEYAKSQARPWYNSMEKMGDLEVKQVAERFKNMTAAGVKSLKKNRPEEYEAFLREMAEREKLQLLGNPQHFVKDAKRSYYINTLADTAKNPDVSATITDKNGAVKKYLLKKYNNELGNDIYDLIIQKEGGGIYNKFPTNVRYAAKQFKEPLDNLSVQGVRPSVIMGTDPSLTGNNILSDLGNYVKNSEKIQGIIKGIRRNANLDALNPGLRQAADTDFRMLDHVKRELDRQIGKLSENKYRNAEQIASLEIEKNRLIDQIDQATGGMYRRALGIYENRGKLLTAQKVADDIFDNNVSLETFRAKVADMSPAEKESLIVGVRDNVLKKLDAKNNENLAYNVFRSQGVRKKLKEVLGETAFDTLTKYADARVKSYQNYNRLLNGSPTSINQQIRDSMNPSQQETIDTIVKSIKQPLGLPGILLERFAEPWKISRNEAIAEILTSEGGDALRKVLREAEQREKNNLIARLLETSFVPAVAVNSSQ